MPFADDSGPRAANAQEFHERNRNEVRRIVLQNPAFALVHAAQTASADASDVPNDIQSDIAIAAADSERMLNMIVDNMCRELGELETLYFSTIERMAQYAEEMGSEETDDFETEASRAARLRPRIAMRFDEAGRLVTMGMFPLSHGFHEAP